MKSKLKTRQKLTEFIRKSYILKFIYFLIPLLWFTIVLELMGCFKDRQNNLTPLGGALTALLFLGIALLTFFYYWDAKGQAERGVRVLEDIHKYHDMQLGIYERKYQNIFNDFKDYSKGRNTAVRISYRPDEEITRILRDTANYFSSIAGIERYHISTSLFYRFDYHTDNWFVLKEGCVDTFGGAARDTAGEEETFADYVLNGDYCYYYLKDKKSDGIDKRLERNLSPIYKLSGRDTESAGTEEDYGSIIGYKFQIKADQTKKAEAMLFLSTYGAKLDDGLGAESKGSIFEDIRSFVLPNLEWDLKTELMQLYIYDSSKKQKKSGSCSKKKKSRRK